MQRVKSYKEFLNEGRVGSGDSAGIERLHTPDEVIAMNLGPEKEAAVLAALEQMQDPWNQHEITRDKIEALVIKRNANKGENWDKYQPEILKLAGVREKHAQTYSSIMHMLTREIKVKSAASLLFIVEKI